jgi:hypothetical protein
MKFILILSDKMDESIILGLHNAYKSKYEQDFEPNTKTFVAESSALKKYFSDLCAFALGATDLSAAQAFETKNRVLYIVTLT